MFRADFTILDEVEVSLIKYHIVFHFRLFILESSTQAF